MPAYQFAHNDNFSVFMMIIKGKGGDQHKSLTWNLKSMYEGDMWHPYFWLWDNDTHGTFTKIESN